MTKRRRVSGEKRYRLHLLTDEAGIFVELLLKMRWFAFGTVAGTTYTILLLKGNIFCIAFLTRAKHVRRMYET